MVVDWELTTLGAEAELICGFPFRSSEYTDNPCDVRLLRGDNIVQGNIRWANAKRWSLEDAANFEQYELKKDDVVLAMDRPWIDAGLKYAAIGDDDLPCLLLQRTSRLRGGQNLDIRFLRYVIGSPEFTKHIQSITTGSLVPHISSRQIKDFAFKLPPLATQKRIAAVLSALDAKIALNQRINLELEGMAKLLYDYWFVQYDFPLSAAQAAALGKPRLAGQPYRTSGGKMVFNPTLKREIPEGWEVGSLSELCHLNHRTWPNKDHPDQVTYLDLANAKNGEILSVQNFAWDESPSRARRILTPGDTIIGTVRPGNRSFALVPNSEEILTGSTGFAVLTPKSAIYREFNYLSLTSESNINRLTTVASGAAYPAVNPEVAAAQSIALPDAELIQQFHQTTASFFNLIERHRAQNQELTALRDWLLPMLMNGQVRVTE